MAGQGSAPAPSSTGGVAGAAAPTNPNGAQSAAGATAIGANAGVPRTTKPAAEAALDQSQLSITNASALQGEIQTALQNEPTLRGDSVNVSVNDSTIELSGTVQTGKERETANRIASSFAGNRRVKDKITVSGRGSSNPNPGSSMNNNPAGNPQNRPASNPATNGDASSSPR